jgi:hypothetical protein
VTEFGYQRDFVVADKQVNALNERLGFFAHELRNQLCTATLALSIIKMGKVGLTGATGGVLDRALVGLSNLIDRSLAEVRMTAGMPLQHRLFSVADFLAEIKLSASLEADVKGCILNVSQVDPSSRVLRTEAAWGWGCRSLVAASRPTLESSACETSQAVGAFLLSTCHATRRRKRRPSL